MRPVLGHQQQIGFEAGEAVGELRVESLVELFHAGCSAGYGCVRLRSGEIERIETPRSQPLPRADAGPHDQPEQARRGVARAKQCAGKRCQNEVFVDVGARNDTREDDDPACQFRSRGGEREGEARRGSVPGDDHRSGRKLADDGLDVAGHARQVVASFRRRVGRAVSGAGHRDHAEPCRMEPSLDACCEGLEGAFGEIDHDGALRIAGKEDLDRSSTGPQHVKTPAMRVARDLGQGLHVGAELRKSECRAHEFRLSPRSELRHDRMELRAHGRMSAATGAGNGAE
jgi:hypothetical protein